MHLLSMLLCRRFSERHKQGAVSDLASRLSPGWPGEVRQPYGDTIPRLSFSLPILILVVCYTSYGMRPPCEVVIKYVLPAFRCSVARSLVTEYGFTQVKTASALGTTQAAISYYLGERRGSRIRGFEENELVRSAAVDVAKELATGQLGNVDATAKFCQLCSKLRSTDAFCQFHRSVEEVDPGCNTCKVTGC